MGEKIGEMDIEPEEKDNEIKFLENKIGIPDDKIVEEMIKLNLNNLSNKQNNDRINNGLRKTLNNHKYTKN